MNWAPAVAGRLALIVAVIAVLVGPSATTLWVSTPDASDIQSRVQALTRAYGVPLLGEFEVPNRLAEAVVAIEDERFYSHHGVDSIGVARSILYDVVNVCLCEGGSTITQQLVKDVYLGGSNLGYHKLEGMALALKVERILSKRRIMADYLSEIPTGSGRNGVTVAACTYFHAPLQGLTLGQYALLAGVTQAPSVYDPTINPQAAMARRAEVLQAMRNDSFITVAQANAANAEPVLQRGLGGAGC